MTPELALLMIQKGHIHQNTEIDAYYSGTDISGAKLARARGNFTLLGAKKIKDRLIFEVVSTRDGIARKIFCEDILMIDGMDPDRFACNFGMTPDGDTIQQGKRRGRKPKVRPQ